jgi:hypothetical protein
VTHAGRFVAALTGLSGAINTALFINAVGQFTAMPPDGQRVLTAFNLSKLNHERREVATRVIRTFIAVCAFRYRGRLGASADALAAAGGKKSLVAPMPRRTKGALGDAVPSKGVGGGARGRGLRIEDFTGHVPDGPTRSLIAARMAWRDVCARFQEMTHNKTDTRLVYLEVLELSDKLSMLSAQASAERRRAARIVAAARADAASARAELAAAKGESSAEAAADGAGAPAADAAAAAAADGEEPEAPPDPFAPEDAAECEALEKAQQKMLEGQRILAHPRTALFQEQFEKQTRSREARTAEAARALAERLEAEGGEAPSKRKLLVATQAAAAAAAAAASSHTVSVGSGGDGDSAR